MQFCKSAPFKLTPRLGWRYFSQIVNLNGALLYFSTFFQKLGFRISQFSQWNYIETYNYLYLLDSEKSKVYFLSCYV